MEISELKSILTQNGYFNTLAIASCTCSNCDLEENYPSWYTCPVCDRSVPYCNGQDDEYFELCDECAVKAIALFDKTHGLPFCGVLIKWEAKQ